MNYKKIFRSRALRIKILQFLKFIPDKQMIRLQYFIKTGRHLNLNNPKRFTEKIQWYKLYYRDNKMIRCVDKYDVREYIKELKLEWILTDCFGVYNSPEQINISSLPNQFVLKDTLGGGGNSVVIVQNKSEIEIPALIKQMRDWVSVADSYIDDGREWPYYYGKRHRIIIEELLHTDSSEGLIDYKFFCFNGRVNYIYVITDRELGKTISLGIFDRNFQQLNAYRADENKLTKKIDKPVNFDKMIQVSESISKNFPHARVDLYNIKGRIVFGEITFYDGSGYMQFDPDSFDFKLGEEFKLPDRYNNLETRR